MESEALDASKKIKCVVWDLDNTIWDGVLLENDTIRIRSEVPGIIKALDHRGILQSISSKNEHDAAMLQLERLGLSEYFIYPQINWNSKSSSIREVARCINIGVDSIAFIDDQAFEREEVKFSVPEVTCVDVKDLGSILETPAFNPRFITEDSRLRRAMYQSDIRRNSAEMQYDGVKEEFLASLGMAFTIAPVGEGDLQRAEELTMRTHQLNATGYTYSYEELDAFRRSSEHRLYIASLEDRFGSYGKIGLTLVECQPDTWTLKLLLMSCRVMSKGVGTIMLNHIIRLARQAHARLLAEFVPTERNRMMQITYKFAGFEELEV